MTENTPPAAVKPATPGTAQQKHVAEAVPAAAATTNTPVPTQHSPISSPEAVSPAAANIKPAHA